jgi:negative modulator of initiation of replication
MKYIEIDEELYRYIASQTERIGESASDILRRLINLPVPFRAGNQLRPISQPSLESHHLIKSPPAPKIMVKPTTGRRSLPEVSPLDSLLQDKAIQNQKGAVGRFLYVLERLENVQGAAFKNVLNIQGRNRLYFATSRQQLIRVSPSSNPKQIGASGYWVITNNNTAKKRDILKSVLKQSGINSGKANQISDLI